MISYKLLYFIMIHQKLKILLFKTHARYSKWDYYQLQNLDIVFYYIKKIKFS